MGAELASLWRALGDADYAYLLLESVTLYGLAFGLLLLGLGFVVKDMRARVVALGLIAACCLTVGPYCAARAKAMPAVLAVTDSGYHPLIVEQTLRRTSSRWLYYLIALIAMAAAVLGHRGKGALLMVIVLFIGSLGLIHSLWLHKKEAEILHRHLVGR